MPVNLVLRRQRQEDLKFETRWCYIASSRPPWATVWGFVSKKQIKKGKEGKEGVGGREKGKPNPSPSLWPLVLCWGAPTFRQACTEIGIGPRWKFSIFLSLPEHSVFPGNGRDFLKSPKSTGTFECLISQRISLSLSSQCSVVCCISQL
jgi:hypothetical protein